MGFHEKRWLDQFQFCDVLLYHQYTDDIVCLFNSEQDDDEFFKFLNSQRSNIKFTFEKEKDDKLAFLDVLISKTDQNFCTSVYLKMTSIALYTNFLSLKVHFYKLRLIKTLIYRIYETNSSWTSFNEEVSNIKHLLMKNMYPSYLIDKQVKHFLHNQFSTHNFNAVKETRLTLYYKLPYIASFSNNTRKNVKELCNRFCKNSNVNIVVSLFKSGDLFSSKDCLPNGLKSFVVYKFVCAGSQFCYIDETKGYLPTRINELLLTDKKSHIFKHLLENQAFKNLCDKKCFTIIDSASSSFKFKLKEALHITWLKSNLNKQKEHVIIKYHHFSIITPLVAVFLSFLSIVNFIIIT